MEKRIYLCGFMGSGKTTVGEVLAKKIGYPFVDLDVYIEQAEGRSIPDIFAQDGEAYFRTQEARYLREMPVCGGAVVSTGGGTLLREENAAFAQESGVVVFLDVPFDVCWSRIYTGRVEDRPLAAARTREELKLLYEKRRDVYLQAARVVVDGNDTPYRVADRICDRFLV